jgi:dTDP-glucose 4,6-dehydratase
MTKNILITGGCGFIGSNFINYLHNIHPEYFIVNYDKIDYCSNPEYVKSKNNYVLVKSDLNNTHVMMTTLKSYNIDTVIHFAAQSHVDNSFGNSIQFTIDNILGTHNLLECCRIYGKINRFIHISTDEVYGEVDLEHDGCTEKSLLNPTNPYAATKAAAEFLVRSYFYSYKLPIIITRSNNVMGPNQYKEKLIPCFISKLLNGEKCPIQGTGQTRRNFIYVDDVSRAINIILDRGLINETYNIGSEYEYSVLDIHNYLYKALDIKKPKEETLVYVEDRLFNDFRYKVDYTKLISLGWNIETTFEEAMTRTIQSCC